MVILHRFQMYNSIVLHQCITLCAHHPSNLMEAMDKILDERAFIAVHIFKSLFSLFFFSSFLGG